MKASFWFLALVDAVVAREVPANVKSFANRVKSGKCTGGTILKDGKQIVGQNAFRTEPGAA